MVLQYVQLWSDILMYLFFYLKIKYFLPYKVYLLPLKQMAVINYIIFNYNFNTYKLIDVISIQQLRLVLLDCFLLVLFLPRLGWFQGLFKCLFQGCFGRGSRLCDSSCVLLLQFCFSLFFFVSLPSRLAHLVSGMSIYYVVSKN